MHLLRFGVKSRNVLLLLLLWVFQRTCVEWSIKLQPGIVSRLERFKATEKISQHCLFYRSDVTSCILCFLGVCFIHFVVSCCVMMTKSFFPNCRELSRNSKRTHKLRHKHKNTLCLQRIAGSTNCRTIRCYTQMYIRESLVNKIRQENRCKNVEPSANFGHSVLASLQTLRRCLNRPRSI